MEAARVLALKAHLDLETRSPLDLTRVGVYRYVEDQDTSIWLFSYRFDNGPIQRWLPGQGSPAALLEHIAADGWVVAHNANFERQVWNAVVRRLAGAESWPRLRIQQCECTMARALAVHLPPDLDTLAQVLGLPEQKDKEGRRLMLQMSKPRKRNPGGTFIWWNDPEKIERLGAYCDQDVATECAVDAKLPPLSDDERALWELDQRVNDRGMALDIESIHRCVAVLEVAQERANARMCELTGGTVRKVTEVTRIVEWLKARGVPAASIAKAEQSELISWSDMLGDETAVEVIRLRAEAGRSSTAKFQTMLRVACADGRVRGALQYHRANTGRWGGALVQPQNLPRVDEKMELPAVLGALEIMGCD
jgi:DNA polymerase bacteriophage-type